MCSEVRTIFQAKQNYTNILQAPYFTLLVIAIWDSPGQGLAMRVLSIARDIARYRPMAVLLQEVIPPALESLGGRRD